MAVLLLLAATDEGCLFVRVADGTRTAVLWPQGFTARATEAGTLDQLTASSMAVPGQAAVQAGSRPAKQSARSKVGASSGTGTGGPNNPSRLAAWSGAALLAAKAITASALAGSQEKS